MTLIQPEAWKPQGIDDLEDRAWDALKLHDQTVVVTASAGAGKTEFLAQKGTYLLQTGLCPAPKRILAISFKRDAAYNLAKRIEKRCPKEQSRRFNSYTFDAFAKGLIDRFGDAIPNSFFKPGNYKIVFHGKNEYTDFLIRKNYKAYNFGELESAIKNTRLPICDEDGISKVLKDYWREQYEYYDEAHLTFPMINRLAEWLLRENDLIRRALQLTYPIIFLDEFQDTTYAQFELLRVAFDDSGAVFTAVGDNKQSIMRWAEAMPDAIEKFQNVFSAESISLLCNWRSHEDLVKIQHVISREIDENCEASIAQADCLVDGDVASIWDFDSNQEEAKIVAEWINMEVRNCGIQPHQIAILVRQKPDDVEEKLADVFSERGLILRNEARIICDISIQDIICEVLTEVFLSLLRLGATKRSAEDWIMVLNFLQYLESIGSDNDLKLQHLEEKLEQFVRELRELMTNNEPAPKSAQHLTQIILEFITEPKLRQAIPSYRRKRDFDRACNGFIAFLSECADRADSWTQALNEFIGLEQVPLMTIHKSKGLEFHTMIFYGLDDETWWSLTPDRPEELNAFFVAFSRAEQRAFFTLCRERGGPVSWIEDLLSPAGVQRVDGNTLLI